MVGATVVAAVAGTAVRPLRRLPAGSPAPVTGGSVCCGVVGRIGGSIGAGLEAVGVGYRSPVGRCDIWRLGKSSGDREAERTKSREGFYHDGWAVEFLGCSSDVQHDACQRFPGRIHNFLKNLRAAPVPRVMSLHEIPVGKKRRAAYSRAPYEKLPHRSPRRRRHRPRSHGRSSCRPCRRRKEIRAPPFT